MRNRQAPLKGGAVFKGESTALSTAFSVVAKTITLLDAAVSKRSQSLIFASGFQMANVAGNVLVPMHLRLAI